MRWLLVSILTIWTLAIVTVAANEAFAGATQTNSANGMVDTASLLTPATDHDIDAARVRLADAMVDLGVAGDDAEKRVARLPVADVLALDHRLDEEPAGAGVLGAVAVVFLILVITDALGVTNIFAFVRPAS